MRPGCRFRHTNIALTGPALVAILGLALAVPPGRASPAAARQPTAAAAAETGAGWTSPDEEIVRAKEAWQEAYLRGDRAGMRAAELSAGQARTRGGSIPAGVTLAEARALLQPRLREHRVPGSEPWLTLHLRERRPGWVTSCRGPVVLFLHPFGVPAAEAFDVPGFSWMEYVARRGWDAFALDIRGFGRSSRPPEMGRPANGSQPVVRATDGVRDVDAAVDYIRRVCTTDRVSVVGWSWGAVVAGMYAAEHPNRVDRLVLYGAMHGFDLPWMAKQFEDHDNPGQVNPKLPAYQVVGVPALKGHWDLMIGKMTGPGKADARSQAALDAVSKVFLASDPTPPKEGQIRRPMGPLVDLYYIWTSRPLYDASRIKAPVLLVRGDRDEFADPTFLDRLTGAADRREVVIGDGTHWLIYERNRQRLLRAVQSFLEEDR